VRMRLGLKARNPIEWLLVRANVVPAPLAETQIAYTLARLIMVGTKLGIFDALEHGPCTAEQVAEHCGTDVVGTEKLLFALAGSGYLRPLKDSYELSAKAQKWLLRSSRHSIADKLIFQLELEWDYLERSEDYVRTGVPLDLHTSTSEREWDLYQRGMRSMAKALASETVRRIPIPGTAREMLDIGGSHGYYSVALCRRHRQLRSVILDLPAAVAQAAPLLAEEEMGDRVVHRAGNALTDDLVVETFDVIMAVQVMHHFSAEQNADLVARIARALRPGGSFVVVEAFRPATAREAGQFGALLEFYFALTSQSGTWSGAELADWQGKAGLTPHRPIMVKTVPGIGIQHATKET
jgi:SAM-dependent methyltransferase